MATLEDSLDALNLEMERADARLGEVAKRSGDASATVLALHQQVNLESQKLVPLSAALTAHLENRRRAAEEGLDRLQGKLGGLESELGIREQATRARLESLQPIVEQLSQVLQRLQLQFLDQQQSTESALQQAAERIRQAFAQSQAALVALDRFVQEDFTPRLAAHEQANETAREQLAQKVQQLVLPALEAQLKTLKVRMDSIAQALAEQSQKAGEQVRTQTEQSLADSEAGTRQRVQTLTEQTAQSTQKLGEVTSLMGAAMGEQQKADQALLQALQTVVPQVDKLAKIPQRLEEVLKKARVIR